MHVCLSEWRASPLVLMTLLLLSEAFIQQQQQQQQQQLEVEQQLNLFMTFPPSFFLPSPHQLHEPIFVEIPQTAASQINMCLMQRAWQVFTFHCSCH